MENREIAIRLSGVKKMYKLGQIGGGTLRGDLESWWARVRGKEDPNSKIGTDQRLIGQTFMALNGIDLTVYKGEALGIIGGNGAGKSTMLKLLSRVTAPTAGKIWLNGRVASMLEVGTGFNGEMTGRENIYMNGAILGMTRAEIDAKMEDIIEFSEVREFIDTPVKRYSSGMYVKLAFSVAAHLDSEIMIMDEVLAVGDINFQQKCLKKMRDVAKKDGRTVLYVSHNMNTIRQLCDRCIVLDKGRIMYDGCVEEAISIYSDTKQTEISKYYDISKSPRNGIITDRFHLNTVTLQRSIITESEKLQFSISLHSVTGSDCVTVRMVFLNTYGNIVGTAFSKPLKVRSGDNDILFTFDATVLAPGTYKVDIVISEHKEGIQIRHDSVADAFSFVVEETIPVYNIKWNSQYWGNTRLPELKQLKEEDFHC